MKRLFFGFVVSLIFGLVFVYAGSYVVDFSVTEKLKEGEELKVIGDIESVEGSPLIIDKIVFYVLPDDERSDELSLVEEIEYTYKCVFNEDGSAISGCPGARLQVSTFSNEGFEDGPTLGQEFSEDDEFNRLQYVLRFDADFEPGNYIASAYFKLENEESHVKNGEEYFVLEPFGHGISLSESKQVEETITKVEEEQESDEGRGRSRVNNVIDLSSDLPDTSSENNQQENQDFFSGITGAVVGVIGSPRAFGAVLFIVLLVAVASVVRMKAKARS